MPLPPLHLFRDWYIFFQAGKAIQEGISPYLVEGFINPIQTAYLLSFTTFFPFTVWVAIMCGAAFILIIVLNKKKSHWTLLSLPFIFGLSMGSLDVFFWVPARLLGGWGLPLLTLKPQIGVYVIPLQLGIWLRNRNFKEIRHFAIGFGLLWGIPTLVQPKWVVEWLRALPGLDERMHWAASLAGFSALTGGELFYILIFIAITMILLFRGSNNFYLAASFSPSIWPSDWIIASEFISWRFTILSWILVFTGLSQNGAQFYFLLGFLVWAEQHPERLRNWLAKARNLFRLKRV